MGEEELYIDTNIAASCCSPLFLDMYIGLRVRSSDLNFNISQIFCFLHYSRKSGVDLARACNIWSWMRKLGK